MLAAAVRPALIGSGLYTFLLAWNEFLSRWC